MPSDQDQAILRDRIATNVRLEMARSSCGLRELSRRTAIHPSRLSRMTRGATSFRAEDIVLIAAHLDTTLEVLLTGR